jgi:hypothetical protein
MTAKPRSGLFGASRVALALGLILLGLSDRLSGDLHVALHFTGLAIVAVSFATFLVSWRKAREKLLADQASGPDETP